MPGFDITILRHDDGPAWPELATSGGYDLAGGDLIRVVGIEGGMTSGAPSLAIRLDDTPSGRPMLVETSLAAWIAATCALRGAFPEAFAGTPLDTPLDAR